MDPQPLLGILANVVFDDFCEFLGVGLDVGFEVAGADQFYCGIEAKYFPSDWSQIVNPGITAASIRRAMRARSPSAKASAQSGPKPRAHSAKQKSGRSPRERPLLVEPAFAG
jgi:hypothetical protein